MDKKELKKSNKQTNLIKFKCVIDRIVFTSENYKIYGAIPDEADINKLEINEYGNITLVGNMPKLNLYSEYTVIAEKKFNPKFGYQYEVESFEIKIPTNKDEVKSFLSEILTELQVIEIMREYPNIIDMVKEGRENEIDTSKLYNIGSYIIDVIVDKIQQNYVFIELINEFSKYGVSMTAIKKLSSKYGSSEMVKEKFYENPYSVMCGLDKIGFKRADVIILKKIPEMIDSEVRIMACIDYVLDENENQGNTLIEIKVLKNQCELLAIQSIDWFDGAIQNVKYKIINNVIMYEYTYQTELSIAKQLIEMIKKENRIKWEYDLSNINDGKEFLLTDEQIGAVQGVLDNNVSLLFSSAGCVDCDTEFFNGKGWKKISEYNKDDMVLQFDPNDRSANLIKPIEYHKYESEYMTHIFTHNNMVNQVLSDEHNFVYENWRGDIKKEKFKNIIKIHNSSERGFSGKILNSFEYNEGEGIDLTDDEIRLMVAVFADGHYPTKNNNRCRFNLKKQRKKDRLIYLLKKCNIEFKEHHWNPKNPEFINYTFHTPLISKQFPNNWYKASKKQLEIISKEVLLWDGRIDKKGRRSFFTTIKSDANFVQFVFSGIGYTSNISTLNRMGQEYKTDGKIYIRKSIDYSVMISKRKNRRTSIANDKRKPHTDTKIIPYKTKDGYKYCFTVPTGMLVLRREDRIFITGNSGKSFTMNTLVNVLDKLDKKYLLLAPTGKASKVLADFTNREASTIHRGLLFNPIQEPNWGYNEDFKMPYDIVILDESSMVDIHLMNILLNAIDKTKTKILFVGDANQIPSISCGNIAHDILSSNIFKSTKLTKVFRYKEGGLAKVSDDVREGTPYIPKSDSDIIKFGTKQDYIIVKSNQEKSTKAILSIYNSLIKKNINHSDIIIAMAMNKGDNGTKKINQIIQKYLIEKTNFVDRNREIKYGDKVFYVGDIVLQIKNNYQIKDINGRINPIFNGNLGKIIDIDKNKNIIIEFDGVKCVYERGLLNQLLLGYAISVHKLQGSQSPYIILSTPKAHTYMMNRNLLYTAITRTQKQCFHVTEEKIIYSSLKKSAIYSRDTLLKILLIKVYNKMNKE